MTAYQTYQANARANVISGSINQIIKAFNACIAINPVATCYTGNINKTLQAQATAAVTTPANSGDSCFVVTGTAGLTGYTGCVAITANGSVTRQSADSDIRNTGSTAACSATGVCTD